MNIVSLRRIGLAALLLTALVPLPAVADEWIELTREIIEGERRQIVEANLEMTEEESDAFLPLYDRYRAEVKVLNTERAEMIARWVAPDKIPFAAIEQMLERWLELDKRHAKIRASFLPKFRKAIPARKVMLFYQIENKLDAVVRYEVADVIPLIDWRED